MKIFNWVHRKLHSKDGSNIGDGKKKQAEKHDTQALLLEQVALADVIDTWKQGILTIGTFGFHPLKDFTSQQKRIQLIIANQKEEEEDEEFESFEEDLEGEGEQNPLVLNAFKHGFNNDICSEIHGQSEITLASDNDHDEEREYKKKERITLADLFSDDSDHHMDVTKPTHHDHHKLPPELAVVIKIKIKPEEEEPAHAKPRLSFAKKLIPPPPLKDDGRPHPQPIKKIHRMMTRILKRKIHPELEGKKENHCGNIGANQTLSLLQTRDVIDYA